MNKNIQTNVKTDPHGYPDFTLPVSVIAQVVETLKVDIASQSIGSLKVDIVAQTVGNLNVNIASSTTLNVNIASSAVTLNVNISAQSIALNIYTSSGYKANVGTGLITKFTKYSQSLNIGETVTALEVFGKGRCISIGIKSFTAAYPHAQYATLKIYSDGALVYQVDLDTLDYINGKQMVYALRSGTSTTPVWASSPLLSPDGGVAAAYGYVANKNNPNGLERIYCFEVYALARPGVEFNNTLKVQVYNAGNDTLVFYAGVEYGLYQ